MSETNTMPVVIIADDSQTARMIVKRCLEISGLDNTTFLEANNGREALKHLKANKVDLLITDFNMPVMDGGILLKWVKNSPNIKDTPVVIITSAGNPAREAELMKDGAYAVLSKPISPAIFMERLEPIITNITNQQNN
jgi:two-component system chemotaxis response regulator CheY